MAYVDVHTMVFGARSAGDVRGRVEVALLRKAALVAQGLVNLDDQRQKAVCRTILDNQTPTSWVTAVLIALDSSAQLATPSDAQVDTATNTAWTYITSARV
jgi:hypothetical protein